MAPVATVATTMATRCGLVRLAPSLSLPLSLLGRRAASSQAAAAEVAGDGAPVYARFGSPVPGSSSGHDAKALGYVPEAQVTTLESGLRVATSAMPHAKTATVGVWIDAGSRFEQEKDNGAAHFLEHMAFKGTNKRTAKSLEQEVENMGGHLNAYTSREQTTYYAKVLGEDSSRALEMISDILQNPTLDSAAVEREKGVILREMEEVESVPEEVLFDHLHATAFQNCSLGRTILGPASNVRDMTRDQLEEYIRKHYTSSRMVVSACGAVDHETVVTTAEKLFGGLPKGVVGEMTGKELCRSQPELQARFTGSEVRIRDPDMPKLHFAIAVEGLPWDDPDAVPLMVMQAMLGGWESKRNGLAGSAGSGSIHTSSLLSNRIAENQLCDSVSSFNTHYLDTGLFGMYAVTDPEKAGDLSWCMMNTFTRLCYQVEPSDVERAKNALKASCLMSLDGTSGVAEDLGRQLVTYGRHMSKPELFARIDAVDADTVKEVAKRVICDQEVAISAMGDTALLPDYSWFRRRTFWLRY